MTLAIVDSNMDLHVHDCGNNIPLAMEMKIWLQVELYYNQTLVFAATTISYLSLSAFFPIQPATIGVRATVGGNLIGDAALCAAYAKAKVPTFSPVASVVIPTCRYTDIMC